MYNCRSDDGYSILLTCFEKASIVVEVKKLKLNLSENFVVTFNAGSTPEKDKF